ncbi:MAG: hypothetical protein AAGF23_08090 [Acidobacteriota bacterium]
MSGAPPRDARYFVSDIPEGRSGDWSLERFVVSEDPSYDPQKDPRPHFARRYAGTFSLLRRGDVQFMTDLYDEWWTQRVVLDEAAARGGHLLISGLGLGMIVESVLRSPGMDVESITVIEKSPDVIRLVAPTLTARYPERLEIVEADVFRWTPPDGRRYSVAWHDIWPSPYDVESETDALRRRYAPWADWIGTWPEEHRDAYRGMGKEASAPSV